MRECAPLDLVENHAKLLAEMVPPLSSPAEGMAMAGSLAEGRRTDMNAEAVKNADRWPDSRPEKTPHQQERKRWLHGDYKDAPFRLTHGLYGMLVEIAE